VPFDPGPFDSKLCHASGAGDVAYGGQEDIGIGVFQCGGDVFRDGFFVVEVVGCIEGGKFGRGLLLVQCERIKGAMVRLIFRIKPL
jgi:hypothetical protein